MTETTEDGVGPPSRWPSAGACAAFSLGMGLFAALIATSLRSSVDEGFPVTLTLFALALGLLRFLERKTFWRSACCLALLFLVPCLCARSSGSETYTSSANLACQTPLFDPTFANLLFFPLAAGDATLFGVAAGLAASMVLRWTRFSDLLLPLRWVVTLAALVSLGAVVMVVRGRPSAEAYLSGRPIVATLAPPIEVTTELHEVAAGPLLLSRDSSSVRIRAAGSQAPSDEGIGCLDAHTIVLLREDSALGLWFFEYKEPLDADAGRFDSARTTRVAFRLDSTAKSGVAPAAVTTTMLLPRTKPPSGWILTPLLGVALSLHAGWRRRGAMAALRKLAGPVGARAPGEPGTDSPYRVEASSQDDAVATEARDDSIYLARLRVIEPDLYGLTSVTLSLLAMLPWLLEVRRALAG